MTVYAPLHRCDNKGYVGHLFLLYIRDMGAEKGLREYVEMDSG